MLSNFPKHVTWLQSISSSRFSFSPLPHTTQVINRWLQNKRTNDVNPHLWVKVDGKRGQHYCSEILPKLAVMFNQLCLKSAPVRRQKIPWLSCLLILYHCLGRAWPISLDVTLFLLVQSKSIFNPRREAWGERKQERYWGPATCVQGTWLELLI